MSLPIIFLHKGPADYLLYTLKQAIKWNPNSDVILLGDESNKKNAELAGALYFPYEDYKTEAQNVLVKHYKHMSTNPAHYELICIARWFIINEYMEKNNIEHAFITDSDVLLYCNVQEEMEYYWHSYRCTLTHNTSAGISFILDRNILREHCDFVIDCYTGKNKFYFDKAKAHYETLQKNGRPGGVCDMTWWGFFRYLKPPGDFGETMDVRSCPAPNRISDLSDMRGHSTFDHNINVSYGYKIKNGIKHFKFYEKVPYCNHERLGEIKFNCIHFQGGAKGLIKKFYEKTR